MEAEAALAGLRLQHANILAPEAVRRSACGDRAEVWMALAEGGSLGDLIKRAKYGGGALSDTKLGEAAARALFLGVADGVAYLHGKGVCHGDIKLGNVVLDANNAPRLVDFGCARSRRLPTVSRESALASRCGSRRRRGRKRHAPGRADFWVSALSAQSGGHRRAGSGRALPSDGSACDGPNQP